MAGKRLRSSARSFMMTFLDCIGRSRTVAATSVDEA